MLVASGLRHGAERNPTMEDKDKICRVLAILIRGLPDVVELPFTPPDSILYSKAKLSRVVMAVLFVLAQDQVEITLDRILEFLLEVKKEIKDHPEDWKSLGIAA